MALDEKREETSGDTKRERLSVCCSRWLWLLGISIGWLLIWLAGGHWNCEAEGWKVLARLRGLPLSCSGKCYWLCLMWAGVNLSFWSNWVAMLPLCQTFRYCVDLFLSESVLCPFFSCRYVYHIPVYLSPTCYWLLLSRQSAGCWWSELCPVVHRS